MGKSTESLKKVKDLYFAWNWKEKWSF